MLIDLITLHNLPTKGKEMKHKKKHVNSLHTYYMLDDEYNVFITCYSIHASVFAVS